MSGESILRPPTHESPAETVHRCPLCGESAPWILRTARRDLFRCRRCDLVFIPTWQHPSAESAKQRYDRHENTPDCPGYVNMFRRFLGLVRAFCPESTNVLDYGGGPASVLAEMMSTAGYSTQVYDPLFLPDARPGGPFDLIVSTEVFEHFAQPAVELDRIADLLRPGGCLAITTLFHHGEEHLRDWWYLRDPTHVAFYSQRTCEFIGGRYTMATEYIDSRNTVIFRRAASA